MTPATHAITRQSVRSTGSGTHASLSRIQVDVKIRIRRELAEMLRALEIRFRIVAGRKFEGRIRHEADSAPVIAPNRKPTHSRPIALGLRPDVGMEKILDPTAMAIDEDPGTAIEIVFVRTQPEPLDVVVVGRQ